MPQCCLDFVTATTGSSCRLCVQLPAFFREVKSQGERRLSEMCALPVSGSHTPGAPALPTVLMALVDPCVLKRALGPQLCSLHAGLANTCWWVETHGAGCLPVSANVLQLRPGGLPPAYSFVCSPWFPPNFIHMCTHAPVADRKLYFEVFPWKLVLRGFVPGSRSR